MRKRMNLSLDEEIVKKFRKMCVDLNETVSGRVQKLMVRDLESHKHE